MINAYIDKAKINVECSGNLPMMMTETAVLLGRIIYNLHKESGIPIEIIGQGIGLVLPDIINDCEKGKENE